MPKSDADSPHFPQAEGDDLAARFDHILDRLPQMVWANEDYGRSAYYNRQWIDFTGVDLSNDPDRDRLSLVHPDDRDEATAVWQAAQQSGRYEHEYRLRHHSGAYCWMVSRGVPRHDDEGRIVAWYGTCTNVHEQKLATEALRESEALNRSIIGSSNDAILLLDLDGRIVFLNPAARRELGPNPERVMGERVIDAFPSPFISQTGGALGEAMAGRTGKTTIPHFDTGQGDKSWDVVVTPVLGEDSLPERLVLVARDVTETRDAQERLTQLQRELIHVSRLSAMGTMASTLAHELNQPLTAVRNYVSGSRRLLGAEPLDRDRLRDAMAEVERSAARAGEIIRRLRDMTQRGRSEARLVDVAATVREGLGLALVGSRELGIVTTTEMEPGLLAQIDAVQLQQVTLNLVRNAIEAMADAPRKQLSISVSRAGGDVRICVADSGEGLAPGYLPHLFEAFATTKEKGFGLGLSICRTIIESHGGTISAMPNPDGGAIFSISLPLAQE